MPWIHPTNIQIPPVGRIQFTKNKILRINDKELSGFIPQPITMNIGTFNRHLPPTEKSPSFGKFVIKRAYYVILSQKIDL